jgi:hypothetical protein
LGNLAGIVMAGRFNSVQRTMLLWDESHPYNAVHVVKVAAVQDPERLQRIAGRVLEERGLTGLWIDAGGRRFEYRGGPASAEMKVVVPGDDPQESLRSEIERQINTGFSRASHFTPFRFFVLQDGGAFWMGVVYLHAVADAESMARLVRELVEEYVTTDAPTTRRQWERHEALRDHRPWRPRLWLRKVTTGISQFSALRSSIRPYCSDFDDVRNGLQLFVLGSDELVALKAAGRAFGVTMNDIFLALLMKALTPMVLAGRRPGRELMALGCIVNIRKELGDDRPDVFGLALGSFSVTQPVPETIGVRELAQEIFRQTRRLKRGADSLARWLELRVLLRIMSLFSTNPRLRFYAKNYPMWGGITNMNLSDSVKRSPTAGPTDYLRAVATGPLTPLVLSLTTFAGRIHCSITYRVSFFSAAQIASVKERFVAGVRELEVGV